MLGINGGNCQDNNRFESEVIYCMCVNMGVGNAEQGRTELSILGWLLGVSRMQKIRNVDIWTILGVAIGKCMTKQEW